MKAGDDSELLLQARKALDAMRWSEAEDLANLVLSSDPKSVTALRVAAEALTRQQKLDQAIAAARQLDSLEPDSEKTLSFLAMLYWQARMISSAAACCERLIELNPINASAHNSLGLCCLTSEDWEGATFRFRQATVLAPRVPDFRHNLAGALEKNGLLEEAAKEYREALALKPDAKGSLFNLADLLFRQVNADSSELMLKRLETNSFTATVEERIEEAGSLARHVLKLDPKHADAHALLGSVLQQQGKHNDSLKELELAIDCNPALVAAYWRLTRSKRIGSQDHALIEKMKAMTLEPSLSAEDRILLHNALGKGLDDMAEFHEALLHFDEAHAVAKAAAKPFDREAFKARIDAIISSFDQAFFSHTAEFGSDSSLPIFVVGMPRSGTTLTEQILSSHSQAAGAGEVPYWPELARDIWNPLEPRLNLSRAESLAARYLELLAHLAPNSVRVVDKNPYNAEHVGLLHALFPQARNVYCTRHPIDNCLSIYMANFRFPPSYVHDREDLVFAYRENQRLFAYWKRVIPEDRFMEVPYERLVSDREERTRKLIEFCGLPWEDACLRPEMNARLVMTASQWQVRQPVYRSSLDRWKNYEPWLGPFRQLIDPQEI